MDLKAFFSFFARSLTLVLILTLSGPWALSSDLIFDRKVSKAEDWANFHLWRQGRRQTDQSRTPASSTDLRGRGKSGVFAQVLSCVGTCQMKRGNLVNKLRTSSLIQNGDEVFTEEGSYLYLVLKDGTLLRQGPETKLMALTFAKASSSFFVHLKVLRGHVAVISRSEETNRARRGFETDFLPLPLTLLEANALKEEGKEAHSLDQLAKRQFERLKEVWQKNVQTFPNLNETLFLLDFPKFSLLGKQLDFMGFIEPMGMSYLKVSSYESGGDQKTDKQSFPLQVRRVDINESELGSSQKHSKASLIEEDIDLNSWYSVSLQGRVASYSKDFGGASLERVSLRELQIAERPLRRIPTLLLARELLFERWAEVMVQEEKDERREQKTKIFQLKLTNQKLSHLAKMTQLSSHKIFDHLLKQWAYLSNEDLEKMQLGRKESQSLSLYYSLSLDTSALWAKRWDTSDLIYDPALGQIRGRFWQKRASARTPSSVKLRSASDSNSP